MIIERIQIAIKMLIDGKISYQEAFHYLIAIDASEYVCNLPF